MFFKKKISKKCLLKVFIFLFVVGRFVMIVFMLVVEDVKNEYELVVNVGVLLLMLLMMMFRVVVLVSFLLDIVIV